MNDDKTNKPSESGDERTVFVSPGGAMPPAPPADGGFIGDSEPVGVPPEGEAGEAGEAPEAGDAPASPPGPPVPDDAPEAATVAVMPPAPTPRDEADAATVVAMPQPPMPREEPAEAATVIAAPMPDLPDGDAEPATVIAEAPDIETPPPAPEQADAATVIADMPPPPAPEADAPSAEEPQLPEATPSPEVDASAAAETPPPAEADPATADGATDEPPAGEINAAAAREARKIQVGDVLNHIFQVKRFIARGGMGEVFEGVNVNADERVAIKVMLPQIAADERIAAMFRKEARTLTKLQHEALVSYRVLAQEPELGVLYIVTEFIDGVSLGDTLGEQRSPDELRSLLRRLASGLAVAHKLGAIHRDMSPDNVLLPQGNVHQAKIIDFGIAKDLDASAATIVGDSFAGKLNYVAPEQLGDFGREIGPWTDVYSLGLVMLAVSAGKPANMSGSLVDAIDKRRKGPDLSAVPGELRPVLEAMLRPDPKDRLRSMEDVIAMAGGGAAADYAPPPVPPVALPPGGLAGSGVSGAGPTGGGGASKGLLVGGVLAAALAIGAAAWYLMGDGQFRIPGLGGDPGNVQAGNGAGPAAVPAPPANPVEAARAAVDSALPSVTCTWLDIGEVRGGSEGVRVALRGVAGDARQAQGELVQALNRAGIANASVDMGDVAPITQAGCAALDTYRQVRARGEFHLSVRQLRFEMTRQPPGAAYAGQEASNAVIQFNFGNLQGDFALLGIEPSGVISLPIPDREDFNARLAASVNGRPITDLGGDRYQLHIDADHEGWSGVILISGQGPFPQEVVAPPVGARGPNWQQRFLSMAAERGWRVEMIWYESVNRQRDGGPPARPEFGRGQ